MRTFRSPELVDGPGACSGHKLPSPIMNNNKAGFHVDCAVLEQMVRFLVGEVACAPFVPLSNKPL